ncbi:hypothetical protein BN1723_001817 [Verticillium longisporum]|uniref:Uncharacterized protein n=1 Tax=Verticillium longisporum TaxID=100787 RepID=A0A0G4KPW0_VERLO|nr:hypothetical protein BN1723_001817 [Verticillium longisporum]
MALHKVSSADQNLTSCWVRSDIGTAGALDMAMGDWPSLPISIIKNQLQGPMSKEGQDVHSAVPPAFSIIATSMK